MPIAPIPAPTAAQAAPAGAVRLHFNSAPSNTWAVLASLFARRPAQAPATRLDVQFHATWAGARAQPDTLARYRQVCELPASGALPVLYVHIMAMPLHMAILSHAAFPLRLLGLVHWSNQIETLRAIAADEVLELDCSLNGIVATERGQSFSLHTTARAQGEVVWREVSTYLSPLARSTSGTARPAPGADATDWGAPVAQWAVAANTGRRFAGPSGDWNPIHVSALSARLFGYPRAIAHGLYSAARCLALLQPDQNTNPAMRLDLRFKRPLLIPGQVALHTANDPGGDATRFVLRVLPGGEPNIEGRWQVLAPAPDQAG